MSVGFLSGSGVKGLTTVLLASACLVVAACSSGPAGPPTPGATAIALPTGAPNNPVAGTSTDPFQHNNVTVTGHLGDTLNFKTYGGADASGTLVKIFDPAVSTDQYPAQLPSGYHWVGVEITLDNTSSDYENEGSQVDATSSDGTVLTTDQVVGNASYPVDNIQGCTQTENGEEDVQPYTHCEGFVVPDGQELVSVGAKVGEIVTFDLENDLAVWSIP